MCLRKCQKASDFLGFLSLRNTVICRTICPKVWFRNKALILNTGCFCCGYFLLLIKDFDSMYLEEAGFASPRFLPPAVCLSQEWSVWLLGAQPLGSQGAEHLGVLRRWALSRWLRDQPYDSSLALSRLVMERQEQCLPWEEGKKKSLAQSQFWCKI